MVVGIRHKYHRSRYIYLVLHNPVSPGRTPVSASTLYKGICTLDYALKMEKWSVFMPRDESQVKKLPNTSGTKVFQTYDVRGKECFVVDVGCRHTESKRVFVTIDKDYTLSDVRFQLSTLCQDLLDPHKYRFGIVIQAGPVAVTVGAGPETKKLEDVIKELKEHDAILSLKE